MEDIRNLLKKAQKYLRSAAVLLEMEDFDSCASRSYFAMFYAAQAALLQSGYEVTSDQSIRSAFAERFVASGQLPEHAAEILHQGADWQETADYAGTFAIGQEDAEFILQEAEAFVNSLERLIERQMV